MNKYINFCWILGKFSAKNQLVDFSQVKDQKSLLSGRFEDLYGRPGDAQWRFGRFELLLKP